MENKQFTRKTLLTFLLPSLVGLILFMIPISYNDVLTIPVAILAKMLEGYLAPIMTSVILVVILCTGFFTLLAKLAKPQFIERHSFLKHLLDVTWPWAIIRVLGAVFVVMTYFGIGAEAVYSENTGGMVLNSLMPVLFCVFLFAGLLLPLLLNFGLLELLGAALTKVMRPLFNLPGRSAINCITSWLGDGSVGILLTSKQYEEKFYTQREAAVIGTNFSAVSITFTLVVLSQVQLEAYFLPFYLTVCAAGIAAAIIVSRLPPLRHKADLFIDNTERADDDEVIPKGMTIWSWGLQKAITRAENAGSVKDFFVDGGKNAVDMVFAVLPVVMGVGTIALMIAEYTPLFGYLGLPFVPLLELLQIPEAVAASETIMVGFADMFIPSILAASIESDLTRFVIAALSVTQLIYMSEVGALLLGSRIPVNAFELFIIFILRTLITLPIIAASAHFIFG